MFEHRPVDRPYPGLRPFEPHEGTIFFGREGHTDRLLEILHRERFLAVIGPSGGGKSSLVRAGLLPALAGGRLGTGSHWRLALLRPGGQPLLALAQALTATHALASELAVEHAPPPSAGVPAPLIAATYEQATVEAALMAAELRQGLPGFDRLLAQAQARRVSMHRSVEATTAGATRPLPTLNLLIVVDQFEELFTYRGMSTDGAEAAKFVDILLGSCRSGNRPRAEPPAGSIRVVVALTMRTDFLGHCVEFADLPEAINHAQYLTPRLKRDELRAAIIGPARVFDGDVDPPFAESLLDELGAGTDQLPLLQHALAQWWQAELAAHAEAPCISAASTRSAGAYRDALNRHADWLYTRMSPVEQQACEAMFRAITAGREGGDAVRRPQPLRSVAAWSGADEAALLRVVAMLAAPEVSFLHHGVQLDRDSVIDLTHEALMRQWDRLRAWVGSELRRGQGWQRWQVRAAEHATGQGGLLTGSDLTRALDWWNPGVSPHGAPAAWQPTAAWAGRYAGDGLVALALNDAFLQLQQYLADSRDAIQRAQEAESIRLQQEAAASRAQAYLARRRSRRYAALSAFAVAFAVLALLSWLRADRLKVEAVQANQAADVQAALAREQRALAEESRLAAEEAAAVAEHSRAVAVAESSRAGEAARAAQFAEQRATSVAARAKALLAQSTAIRLAVEGEAIVSQARPGDLLRGLLQILAAHRIAPGRETDAALQTAATRQTRLIRLQDVGAGVQGFSMSTDGSRVLWADAGALRVWDTRQDFAGHRRLSDAGPFRTVAVSPDGRLAVSAAAAGELQFWDAATGAPAGSLQTGQGDVRAIAYSRDGARFLTVAGNGVQVWDAARRVALGAPMRHEEAVNDATFSPDGQWVATAADDTTVRLWSTQDGQPVGDPLRGHTEAVTTVAFSADGARLVSGSSDRTVRVWDAVKRAPVGATLRGHVGIVSRVTFSHDGRKMLSADREGMIMCWEWTGGSVSSQVLSGHSAGIAGLGFSADDRRVVSAAEDGSLRLWNIAPDASAETVRAGLGDYALSVAFSPDGQWLAAGGQDASLTLWKADGAGAGRPLTGHFLAVDAVAFSPDSTTLASAGSDATIRLWSIQSGQPVGAPWTGHVGPVRTLAFAPGGAWLASGGADGKLRLWDVGARRAREVRVGHDAEVTSVAFSPDGRRLASSGQDGTLALWDAQVGQTKPLWRTSATRQGLLSVAFSPDGQRIVTGSQGGVVQVWNAQDGRPTLAPLQGHARWVTSVLFSRDGSRLASGSGDGTIRFWDAASGAPLGQPLRDQRGEVQAIALSPDGERMASASWDRTIRVRAVLAGWATALCGKLPRNMTLAEWRERVGVAIPYVKQCPELPGPSEPGPGAQAQASR